MAGQEKEMKKIVECIPNFSEGRRTEVIDSIVAAIRSVPGAVLLDSESDADHNRSVVTFVAEPAIVVDAAIAAAKKAAELIDLNNHTGEHPRMGATDVIPFVPISGVTMEECVGLARQCAERMWSELAIPVYLYEKAATRPERENLAAVRKGQFEGIRDDIANNPARLPDFGDAAVHRTAGITAVGARPPLIAYNVNLGTADISIANKIARAVRYQTGGFRYVKALGFELKDRGIVQVSMNMVNYEGTPIYRVFEAVKREAERYGVTVIGSEIVGLVPQAALNASSDFFLQLENFTENQILEQRLMAALEEPGPTKSDRAEAEPTRAEPQSPSAAVGNFAELIAAGTPAPGGGSVAAYCGTLAASLGQMMCNLTIGKKKYAVAEPRVKEINARLQELSQEFLRLIDQDAESFETVMAAYRLPKETDEQKDERTRAIQASLHHAIDTPYYTIERALEVLRLLAELAGIGNANVLPDISTGALLARATLTGAYYNIAINLVSVTDAEYAARVRTATEAALREAGSLAEYVENAFLKNLG